MKPGDLARAHWPGLPCHNRRCRIVSVDRAEDLGPYMAQHWPGETFYLVEFQNWFEGYTAGYGERRALRRGPPVRLTLTLEHLRPVAAGERLPEDEEELVRDG